MNSTLVLVGLGSNLAHPRRQGLTVPLHLELDETRDHDAVDILGDVRTHPVFGGEASHVVHDLFDARRHLDLGSSVLESRRLLDVAASLR